LLREAGVSFRQEVSHIVEQVMPDEDPFAFAQRIAREKAIAVASGCGEEEIVLGGDTIVVLGDQLLGKPVDAEDAIGILETLSGQQHTVGTALALASGSRMLASGIETTRVFFNKVSRDQITEYVASGEPLDKAGAYGIQGMGAFLVDRIEGNLDNVIGLPLTLLNHLARETGQQL
jgi:septum formation protein